MPSIFEYIVEQPPFWEFILNRKKTNMEMEALLSLEEQTEEYVAEKPRKFKKCMPVTIIILMTIGIAVVTTLIVLYVKEHNDNNIQRKSMENEHRRKMDSLFSTMGNERTEPKTISTFREKTGPFPNSSQQSIQDDHLLSVLKQATKDLRLVKSELTQLNISLRSDSNWKKNSLFPSMENLRTELKTMNNSIALAMNTFQDELNSTKRDIVHIFNTLFHHNSSFHSKIQDASDALLMEVKYVEQKLVSIQNSTTREVQQLRRESTNTVKSLRDAHNKIVQSNRSLYTALERTATSLRSSIRNVNGNIVNLRKDIESNKRDMAMQYKNINEELSKKVKFQEFQRKLKIATSGLETKMENNQASQKKVQRSQQAKISKLQDEVEALRKENNHLKNKAISSLHVKECLNMPFVIAFSFVIKYIVN